MVEWDQHGNIILSGQKSCHLPLGLRKIWHKKKKSQLLFCSAEIRRQCESFHWLKQVSKKGVVRLMNLLLVCKELNGWHTESEFYNLFCRFVLFLTTLHCDGEFVLFCVTSRLTSHFVLKRLNSQICEIIHLVWICFRGLMFTVLGNHLHLIKKMVVVFLLFWIRHPTTILTRGPREQRWQQRRILAWNLNLPRLQTKPPRSLPIVPSRSVGSRAATSANTAPSPRRT